MGVAFFIIDHLAKSSIHITHTLPIIDKIQNFYFQKISLKSMIYRKFHIFTMHILHCTIYNVYCGMYMVEYELLDRQRKIENNA